MASNSLTNIMPKILARGLMTLREQAVMPRLVNGSYGSDAAKKGTTIDVPIPTATTAGDVTPSNTPPAVTGNTPSIVQVSLDQWKQADFHLTDKEMVDKRPKFSFTYSKICHGSNRSKSFSAVQI